MVAFKKWSDPKVEGTYGGKAVLDFEGNPVFAELLILRLFQTAGWDGVWVDTFGGKYRTEYWPKNQVTLPETQRELLQKIFGLAGSKKGCWDVFCWRDDIHLFAESKRQGRDQIRATQRQWLEAAIQSGLPLDSFLVIEWSVE